MQNLYWARDSPADQHFPTTLLAQEGHLSTVKVCLPLWSCFKSTYLPHQHILPSLNSNMTQGNLWVPSRDVEGKQNKTKQNFTAIHWNLSDASRYSELRQQGRRHHRPISCHHCHCPSHHLRLTCSLVKVNSAPTFFESRWPPVATSCLGLPGEKGIILSS